MNINNLRIGVRLRLGFGIILAFLIVVAVVANISNANSRRKMFDGWESAHAKVALITTMKSEQLEGVVAIRSIGLQADANAMNKEVEKLNAHRKLFAQASDKLMALGVTEDEKLIFQEITRFDQSLVKPTSEAIGQALGFNSEMVASIISLEIDPVYRKVLAEINKLVELQQAAERDVRAQAEMASERLSERLFLSALIAVIICSGLAWGTTLSITRPIDKAVRVARHVAGGDLTLRITPESVDETGQLMQALKEMNDSLLTTVQQVRIGTYTIATASHRIAADNAVLSSRTEQQACALQEAAASMASLTHTVKQNADNAHQANQLAQSASSVASDGGEVVAQLVDTMRSINASSKKIIDIIGVINGIAFQTNILALNAAVEAARAGEQGRSFAVVAMEVRTLAQRSENAAKEIQNLIQDSVAKIEVGSVLAEQAGERMGHVVSSIERVNHIVGDISAASRAQSVGIEHVNFSVAQIDDVTQQNMTLVEHAASAAEAMRDQAEALAYVVSMFKLDEAQSTFVPSIGEFSKRQIDGNSGPSLPS